MIFCVEDDNNIRDLLVYTLETTGFHARGLEDSQELWKALAEEEPELILLDIMLPGEDGYSILDKLKKSFFLKLCFENLLYFQQSLINLTFFRYNHFFSLVLVIINLK